MFQFELSDREFEEIASLVHQTTGIALKNHKKPLVIARLSKRLRVLEMSGFRDYLRYLKESENSEDELIQLVNAITTNKTDFFREPHHFDFLKEKLSRIVEEGERSGRRRLRVWCSASSTGEEPYSIAMVLHSFFKRQWGWDVQILASDVDTKVLEHAARGVYKEELLSPIPPALRRAYFHRPAGLEKDRQKVRDELRQMIIFRKINLIQDAFQFREPVDIVFCRNVLIYFDDPTKEMLIGKFHRILKAGGFIFVGHSESLLMAKDEFRFVKSTVYERL